MAMMENFFVLSEILLIDIKLIKSILFDRIFLISTYLLLTKLTMSWTENFSLYLDDFILSKLGMYYFSVTFSIVCLLMLNGIFSSFAILSKKGFNLSGFSKK